MTDGLARASGAEPCEGDASAAPMLAALPAPVRGRVLALAADVLPDVVRLPPSLRRVAEFAPARRARLGGTAIGSALGDEEFRERVATQLAARPAYDAARLDFADHDPADAGALAWLLRPEGWEQLLAEAAQGCAERSAGVERESEQVARLRRKLEEADQALREARSRHRDELQERKAENLVLRRKLGESRAAERAVRAEVEGLAAGSGEALAAAEALAGAQEKELRRLRAQVAQSETDASASRRAARTGRDEATLRARLLLDSVIEAAAGLRRELALPAVSGAPGDRVETDLAESGTRAPTSAGALGADSPTLLEQLLTMPRARLIVDGYNVSKTGWPTSSLEAQRIRLLNGLAPVVARTGAETTVVFDAASVTARPVVAAPRGVKVLFSSEGVIADDVIRDLVAAEPTGRAVVVVSSDRAVVRDVVGDGARAVSAQALIGLLTRSG